MSLHICVCARVCIKVDKHVLMKVLHHQHSRCPGFPSMQGNGRSRYVERSCSKSALRGAGREAKACGTAPEAAGAESTGHYKPRTSPSIDLGLWRHAGARGSGLVEREMKKWPATEKWSLTFLPLPSTPQLVERNLGRGWR